MTPLTVLRLSSKTLLCASRTSWSKRCVFTRKMLSQLSRSVVNQSRPRSGGPLPGMTTSGRVNVCPLCSTFTSEMPRTGIVSPVYVDSFAFDCCRIAPFSLNGLKCASPMSETDAPVSISIAVEMPCNIGN